MILTLARSHLRLLLREPMVTVGTIGFPTMTVLILAGVFGRLPDPDFGGVAPTDYYFAGYVAVVLASVGLTVVPVHLATQRELGITRRLRASGLTSRTIVGAEIAIGVVFGIAAVALVVALGSTLYHLALPQHLVAVAAWTLLGAACFVTFGVALGSLVRTSRAATAIGNGIFIPMFLLGGGGPPRAVMTGPMRLVSDVLPLTHIVSGLRGAWLGTTDAPCALWWPCAVAAIAVLAAVAATRRRAR